MPRVVLGKWQVPLFRWGVPGLKGNGGKPVELPVLLAAKPIPRCCPQYPHSRGLQRSAGAGLIRWHHSGRCRVASRR